MSQRIDNKLSGAVLAVMTVIALVLAVVVPLSVAQRALALGMIGVGLAGLAVLHLALRRTPDGYARLGGALPLWLDLVGSLLPCGAGFVVDGLGQTKTSIGAFAVGVTAGVLLSLPISLTLRWIWADRARRRDAATDRSDDGPSHTAPDRADQPGDQQQP